jgi:hypothetical protein
MALQSYFDNLEPESPDEEIWRFLPFALFEDLMANDELYFRRADLFKQDETEGIPPEDFIRRVMGLRPWVLDDERQLSHQMGMLAQDREAFYVSCWHQYRHETAEMWRDFAKDGVAIRSRYDLLRSIMDCMLYCSSSILSALASKGNTRSEQLSGVPTCFPAGIDILTCTAFPILALFRRTHRTIGYMNSSADALT